MKKELYFDATLIQTTDEFYQEIARLLSFPSYFQHNLDDLWTCLTSYIDPKLRLTIRGVDHLYDVFAEQTPGLRDIFEQLPQACPELELLLNN